MATITGTSGNDVLGGTGLDDTIDGGQGTDFLFGGTGNDTYLVDNSGDAIFEDAGQGTADAVLSFATSYTLNSNVENGFVEVGAGATLIGNAGDNTLFGHIGDDTLIGGGGNDQLIGGLGNDVLDGGAGNDTMTGGFGDDTYYLDTARDTVVELPNAGRDKVVLAIDSYHLADNVEDAELGTPTTTSHPNFLFGNDLDNVLTGNGLGNTLTGELGSDSLFGGGGNDKLDGGAGADLMVGGTGDDVFRVDDAADATSENADEGHDRVISFAASWTLADNIEDLQLGLSSGATAGLDGTGNGLDNEIAGNLSINVLHGLDGDDTLSGFGRDDTLFGDAGNDTLDGGSGNDMMLGGSGDDLFIVGDASDRVIELASDGHDTVQSSIDYQITANVEDLVLLFDAVVGQGNAGNNRIDGDRANNTLYGLDGSDTLAGSSGADMLFGDTGNDKLDGGTGNDLLIGGSGADRFFYGADGGADAVKDFSLKGGDVLEFDGKGLGIDDASDALHHAHQSGNFVVFDFGDGNTVSVVNSLLGDFNAKNIIVD